MSSNNMISGGYMNKTLTIMIIEDDEQACFNFKNIISKHHNLKLVFTTNDSKHALDKVKIFIPDVIILDLELHCGCGSGIEFLSKLSISPKPFIIVTTNNSSQLTYKFAHENGCDFLFHKNECDYSEEKVISFVLTMKNLILRYTKDNSSTNPSTEDDDKYSYIEEIFNKIGISPKLLGYKYLFDAIILVSEDSKDNLYSTIAKKYNKSNASVEHAMQNAINKAWNQTDTDILYKYYSARIDIKRGCPTVYEFVYYFATKLKKLS